jgi:hypothetical protein
MQREYVFTIFTFRWTLGNLCNGRPTPDFTLIAPAIPTFAKLLYHKDKYVIKEAALGLSYVSEDENNGIQATISTGCLRRLVELLRFVRNFAILISKIVIQTHQL